jgi:hypothetical protein
MDLQSIGWEGVNWINVTQDKDKWGADVSMEVSFKVPENMGNLLIVE